MGSSDAYIARVNHELYPGSFVVLTRPRCSAPPASQVAWALKSAVFTNAAVAALRYLCGPANCRSWRAELLNRHHGIRREKPRLSCVKGRGFSARSWRPMAAEHKARKLLTGNSRLCRSAHAVIQTPCLSMTSKPERSRAPVFLCSDRDEHSLSPQALHRYLSPKAFGQDVLQNFLENLEGSFRYIT